MHKTILVIGEVTAKQHNSIRIELMRQGHKPKIVRTTPDELFITDEELAERYGDATLDELIRTSQKDYDWDWLADKIRGLALKHMEQFGTIGAIILSAEADDAWTLMSTDRNRPITDLLWEYDYAGLRWHLGDNDEAYLVSAA